jgi:SGNH domain (fused to AT3 domains)
VVSRIEEPVVRDERSNRSVMLDRLTIRNAFTSLMSSPQMLALRKQGKVAYVDPFNSLCDFKAGHCHIMSKGKEPFYRDHKHLTAKASVLVAPELFNALLRTRQRSTST